MDTKDGMFIMGQDDSCDHKDPLKRVLQAIDRLEQACMDLPVGNPKQVKTYLDELREKVKAASTSPRPASPNQGDSG